jgi:hypothetical protein
MATATSICSNAVLMLGAKSINDIYLQVEDRAVLAANLYPSARDAVLRSHPWNCAIARVSLAPDVTVPAFDWAYQFSQPGDWLRTLSVGNKGLNSDYVTEGRKFLSNDNPFLLRYIYRNDNEASWDALLIEAMTLAMRSILTYPITLSSALATANTAEFEAFVRRARAIDGMDDPPETLGDFRLLNSRFSSSVAIIP